MTVHVAMNDSHSRQLWMTDIIRQISWSVHSLQWFDPRTKRPPFNQCNLLRRCWSDSAAFRTRANLVSVTFFSHSVADRRRLQGCTSEMLWLATRLIELSFSQNISYPTWVTSLCVFRHFLPNYTCLSIFTWLDLPYLCIHSRTVKPSLHVQTFSTFVRLLPIYTNIIYLDSL